MTVRVNCPGCGGPIRVKKKHVGLPVPCPMCGTQLIVRERRGQTPSVRLSWRRVLLWLMLPVVAAGIVVSLGLLFRQAPTSPQSLPLEWAFEYDPDGRPTKVVDPGGKVTEFRCEIDEHKRVRKQIKKLADGTEVTFEFDAFGRPTVMKDQTGTVTNKWDEFNRLSVVRREGSPDLEIGFDTEDRANSYTVAGMTVRRVYDFLGRLTKIETPVGDVTYRYFAAQGQTIRTLPKSGIRTVWQQRPDGKLEHIEHLDKDAALLVRFRYSYRPDSLIEKVKEESPEGVRDRSYEYDEVQRLVAVVDSRLGRTEYKYDAMGNRTKVTASDGKVVTSSHDWAGRLVQHNGEDAKHDDSGNLLSYARADGKTTVSHTAENQLRTAETARGKVDYTYDGRGVMIARSVRGKKTSYIPDPTSDIWKPLLAMESDGKRTCFVWEGNLPLAAIRDGHVQFFLHDHLSVRSTADDQGRFVQRSEFCPFGSPASEESGEGLEPGFAGLFFDSATGIYLTRARGYDPALGRFLQRDPQHRIPHGSQQDTVAYSYCGADPINLVDVNGLAPEDPNRFHRAIGAIGRALTPEISANSSFMFRGLSSTLVPGTTVTEDRRTWSPTLIGAGFSFTWGDRAESQARINSFDVGLSRYLGFSVSTFSTSRGMQQAAVSLNLGLGFPPIPVGITRTQPAHNFVYDSTRTGHGLAAKRDLAFVPSRGFGPFLGPASSSGPTITAPVAVIRSTSPASGFPPILGSAGATPTKVGGIATRGASQALKDLGSLQGVALIDGRLVLLAEDKRSIELPSLGLDEIVTIFLNVYQHGESPWVSIDPNPAAPMGDFMLVRLGPKTEQTYVGWVLAEADRWMKSIQKRHDSITGKPLKLNIEGYDTLYDGVAGRKEGDEEIWVRFWITPKVTRRQDTSGRLTLLDIPLQIETESEVMKDGKLLPAPGKEPPFARVFTRWFNAHFDELAAQVKSMPPKESGLDRPVPVFQEVKRIATVVAVAELLRDQGVPLPSWMRDYAVRPFPTPKTTPARTYKVSDKIVIYGGITLSPPKSALTTVKAGAEGEALATALDRTVPGLPLLEAARVENNGKQYQALTFPVGDAVALGACRLEETDLAVPINGEHALSLTRHFHSFFAPSDIFGPAWTLDFVRLEPQLRIEIVGDKKLVSTVYQLTSPLDSVSVLFDKPREVPEVEAELLTGKDMPGVLGVDRIKHSDLGLVQVLLFRDGRRWYFDDAGDLVGRKEAPLFVRYHRDKDHRLKRIEATVGSKRAAIELEYGGDGRLRLARGSNGSEVTYGYSPAGLLHRVNGPQGAIDYNYRNRLVSAVLRDGKLVRGFEYADDGRLLHEKADGQSLTYRSTAKPEGKRASVTNAEGKEVEAIEYDHSHRPRNGHFADGTRVEWKYQKDGSTKVLATLPDGETYTLAQSADGKKETVRSPEGGEYAFQRDDAGRVSTISKCGHLAMRQEWDADGQLRAIFSESVAARPEYAADGTVKSVLITAPEKGPHFKEWLQVELDDQGRPAKVTDSSGLEAAVKYHENGELRELDLGRGKVTVHKEANGAVEKVTTPWGYGEERRYDGGNKDKDRRLTSLVITQGKEKARIDFDGERSVRAQGFDGSTLEVDYHVEGPPKAMPRAIRTPNKLELTYEYDKDGRVSAVNCGNVYRLEYVLDGRGRLTQLTQRPLKK